MIQKHVISFDCLFLHDTQMADLEKEQAILRSLYMPPQNTARPFNVLPPFCPCPSIENTGRLHIGAPANHNGWIIRPLCDIRLPDSHPRKTQNSEIRTELEFPLYPPIPAVPCFILGYAGTSAENLIEKMGHPAEFSVNVWNYAAMTVSVEYEEHSFYSVTYECGKPLWQKASI